MQIITITTNYIVAHPKHIYDNNKKYGTYQSEQQLLLASEQKYDISKIWQIKQNKKNNNAIIYYINDTPPGSSDVIELIDNYQDVYNTVINNNSNNTTITNEPTI